MKPGDIIDVEGVICEFISHPLYSSAHSGEENSHNAKWCTMCAFVRVPHVGIDCILVWKSGENWVLHRQNPQLDVCKALWKFITDTKKPH